MKKGILYAVLASVLWAIVNPFIKQGLSYDFSPMNFAGLRFTVVGIILFAYTWHRGMWREIMQHRRLFGNLILINMFMGYTAFSRTGPSICPDRFRFAGRFSYHCGGKMHVMQK